DQVSASTLLRSLFPYGLHAWSRRWPDRVDSHREHAHARCLRPGRSGDADVGTRGQCTGRHERACDSADAGHERSRADGGARDWAPRTGDDFKFTVMATLRSKKTNHKNNVDQIVGAKEYIAGSAEDVSGIKVDGNNITVSLVNAFCPALNQIGGLSIIPKSVFGKYLDPKDANKNLDDAPENNAPPVASGAFTFKEWVP